MIGRFDDVKVGDKLMRKVTCGFREWNTSHFGEVFFVEVTVERVIKTRFRAGGVDYIKDSGCKVGEKYNQSIFKVGQKLSGYLDIKVPHECQRKEMNLYREKLASIEGYFEISPQRLKCSVDDAVKVSDLIRQIKKITGVE